MRWRCVVCRSGCLDRRSPGAHCAHCALVWTAVPHRPQNVMSGTRASVGAQAQVAALSETVRALQQELEALATQRNTRSAEIHKTELATAETRIATKELEGITNTHTQATAQVGQPPLITRCGRVWALVLTRGCGRARRGQNRNETATLQAVVTAQRSMLLRLRSEKQMLEVSADSRAGHASLAVTHGFCTDGVATTAQACASAGREPARRV